MGKEHLATMVGLTVILVILFSVGVIRQNMESSPKNYIGHNADTCSKIRFVCAPGYVYFSDGNGCGCEVKSVEPAMDPQINTSQCSPESRNGEVCPEIYSPVCGWFDSAKVQCIKYPCASTYSNSCEACHNENVKEYTSGTCPQE